MIEKSNISINTQARNSNCLLGQHLYGHRLRCVSSTSTMANAAKTKKERNRFLLRTKEVRLSSCTLRFFRAHVM